MATKLHAYLIVYLLRTGKVNVLLKVEESNRHVIDADEDVNIK